MVKISIGIPNYNRLENIRRLSCSLKYVKNIDSCEVNVFDDKSTQYDIEVLEKLFSQFSNVAFYENDVNLGADLNTYQICNKFIDSGNDCLLLCDSDLILHPLSLEFIEENIANTEGIMSLLNSNEHQEISRISDKFVSKKYVGAAGVVFSKELLKDIVRNVPKENAIMWDWSFCQYLDSVGVKIYVSDRSYVQHMGFNGENSNFLLYDFGKNYIPDTDFEKDELNKLYRDFFLDANSISDEFKIKVLFRKILRKRVRKLISLLFGNKFLFELLIRRKRRIRY